LIFNLMHAPTAFRVRILLEVGFDIVNAKHKLAALVLCMLYVRKQKSALLAQEALVNGGMPSSCRAHQYFGGKKVV
jgi:hypothetical protein